jgi:hypothetical protein
MSERGARIVRRCSEITIATWRRSGGTGGPATVGLTRPVPYRLRRRRPRARRLGFQSLQMRASRKPSPLMGTARIARRADFFIRKSGPGRTPQRLPCPDHQPAHSAEACRLALSGRHRARWLLRDEVFEKLYNHLYTTIHDDEARKRMSLDSVARRNGIILPGIWTGDERPRWPL